MNESEKLLKQVKGYTLILAIFYTFYSVREILASTFIFAASSIDWVGAGMSVEEAAGMREMASYSGVYMTHFLTITSIVLTVFLYISNTKLKRMKKVSRIPYFSVVFLQFYGLISNTITGSFSVWSLAINVIIAALAITVISNLLKVDKKIVDDDITLEES